MYFASGPSLLISCVSSFHHLFSIYLLWFFAPFPFSPFGSFRLHLSIFVFIRSFFFLFSSCLHFGGSLIPFASIFVSSAVSAFVLLPFITLSASLSNHLAISLSSVTSKAVAGNGTKAGSSKERKKEMEMQGPEFFNPHP